MATFNSPTDIAAGTLAKAADINNLDAAIAAAFAILPTNTRINEGTINFAVDTGAADAYLVALPNAPASYTDGLQVIMRPLANNTGACTINVDSLGIKSIMTEGGVTPAAGDIVAGVPVELRYSTATGYFHMNKNTSAAAAAASAAAAAAAVSAAAALASQNAAAISQLSASGSAAAALISKNAASASESAAAISAAAALVSEGAASASELAAAGSASSASTSASTATTQAGIATGQASAASVSAAAALVSENNTAALYDSFDDRYLGAKAADPTLDNDGNALLAGALYWNTVSSAMKVYSGSAWIAFGVASISAGNGIGVSLVAGVATISTSLKTNGGLVIETGALAIDLGASSITGTLAVADGGTGRVTSSTAYGLIAAGTTATGAHQTLAAGATTEILVGGGPSALPAWTTATGSGAPVRATSPALVTPNLGTPTAGALTNCTVLPLAGLVVGTAENDFMSAAAGTFVWTKRTLAETKAILGIVTPVYCVRAAKTSDATLTATEMAGNYVVTNWGAGDAVELALPGCHSAQYPVAQSTTYVKATTYTSDSYAPWLATDPSISVTGAASTRSWLSDGQTTNQRVHIDLGSAKRLLGFMYHNYHNSGNVAYTDIGAKTFTLWGSNSPTAFAELTYAVDTDWTQLTASQATLDRHSSSDVADEKFISATALADYRYYAFKFADNWGDALYMGIRRIELLCVSDTIYAADFEIDIAQYLRLTASAVNKFRYYTQDGAVGGYIRSNVVGTRFRVTGKNGIWSIHDLIGILNYDQ